MRVLAWNTGWNVSAGAVTAQTEAVARLAPDVAFFSEWSPQRDRVTSAGTTRSSGGHLRGPALANIGLSHQCHEHVSERAGDSRAWAGAYWGVLAVAKTPIRKTLLTPPFSAPGSWLEVTHEDTGLVLVGVRVPAWDGRELHLRRELWLWMVEQFDRLAGTSAIVAGDFNTETSYASKSRDAAFGGDLLRSLSRERGWRDPYAETESSPQPTFWHRASCRRIDHAFVSPAFQGTIDSVEAVTEAEGIVLSGPARDAEGRSRRRLADHAPLVIDVSPERQGGSPEPAWAAGHAIAGAGDGLVRAVVQEA